MFFHKIKLTHPLALSANEFCNWHCKCFRGILSKINTEQQETEEKLQQKKRPDQITNPPQQECITMTKAHLIILGVLLIALGVLVTVATIALIMFLAPICPGVAIFLIIGFPITGLPSILPFVYGGIFICEGTRNEAEESTLYGKKEPYGPSELIAEEQQTKLSQCVGFMPPL